MNDVLSPESTIAPRVQLADVAVAYQTADGLLPAVSGVRLTLQAGTITGLVGESGSGKSTLAMAMLNAAQPPGLITGGSIEIEGLGDVLALEGEKLRTVRSAKIGYVFQAAQNSLNPLKKVGKQVLDLGRSHEVRDLPALLRTVSDLLSRMGMDAHRVLDSYQHELSGGMRQRVGITLALALNAHVLVLDEPTTALDMISQSNILQIIREVHDERGLTTLIVTHDIGVVAEVADRIAVMYGGRLVEVGATEELLQHPSHPYTRALIGAIPRLTGDIHRAKPLAGRPPTLNTVPRTGCVFRDRCPIYAEQRITACELEEPQIRTVDWTEVACHAVSPSDHEARLEGRVA